MASEARDIFQPLACFLNLDLDEVDHRKGGLAALGGAFSDYGQSTRALLNLPAMLDLSIDKLSKCVPFLILLSFRLYLVIALLWAEFQTSEQLGFVS